MKIFDYQSFSDWTIERVLHLSQEIALACGQILVLTTRDITDHEVKKFSNESPEHKKLFLLIK